jgi:hypothetical protein
MSFNLVIHYDILPFQDPWNIVFFNKMQNWEKLRTIIISLESFEGFNKFRGKDFWNEAKMHPPPREPNRENTSKIFIKINELGMVKCGSLERHKFELGHISRFINIFYHCFLKFFKITFL